MSPSTSQALPFQTRAMSPAQAVLVLSLLLGVQPVTTDLYLPALPGLTAGFGASMAQAQLTLTALLLAFGLSQLAWGPLSDRFGRRPILLAGLSAYTLAALGSTLAPSMEALVAWRAVQGAAMGAAVMSARAIVRDLHGGTEGARLMSKALSGLGVLAAFSAPLGGLLAQLAGWRATLSAVAVFGAIALAVVALRFHETLPLERRAPLHPAALARQWVAILRHPSFLAWSALSSSTYCALFTFLASSSFVFIQTLGLSRVQYGLVMSAMSTTYLVGTFLCRRLLVRIGLRRTVAVGGAFALAAGTLLGMMEMAGAHSVAALLGPVCLFAISHGINQPCSQSSAVAPFAHAAGVASALNGFMMMVLAFGVGAWVGQRLDGSLTVLTHGLWFWCACIAFINWVLVPRLGEPRQV